MIKSVKIEGMDGMLKTFTNMMKSTFEKKELHTMIKSTMEPLNHGISSAAVSAGLPPDSYTFIVENDTKYITDKKVTVLSGFKLGPNPFGKLDYKKPQGEDPRFHLILWREFGTRQRYKKDGTPTGYIKPRPFVRPLIDSHTSRILTEVNEGIKDMVKFQAKLNNLIK